MQLIRRIKMKKKLGIVLAVVATAVISIVSLVGCAKPDTDLKPS